MNTLIEPTPFEGIWATLAAAAGIAQCLACMAPFHPDDGARVRYWLPDGSWTPWADVCAEHMPSGDRQMEIAYGANIASAGGAR